MPTVEPALRKLQEAVTQVTDDFSATKSLELQVLSQRQQMNDRFVALAVRPLPTESARLQELKEEIIQLSALDDTLSASIKALENVISVNETRIRAVRGQGLRKALLSCLHSRGVV